MGSFYFFVFVNSRGEPFFLVARPWSLSHSWESAWRPLELAAAQDVEMDVKDGLTGTGPIIEDQTETVNEAEIGGKSCPGAHHPANKLFVLRLKEGRSGNMFFGDDQKMDRRLRCDIPEGQDVIIFIELVHRDIPGNYFTKKTVCVHGFFSYIFKQITLALTEGQKNLQKVC